MIRQKGGQDQAGGCHRTSPQRVEESQHGNSVPQLAFYHGSTTRSVNSMLGVI